MAISKARIAPALFELVLDRFAIVAIATGGKSAIDDGFGFLLRHGSRAFVFSNVLILYSDRGPAPGPMDGFG